MILNEEQRDALDAFAKAYGKKWRSTLTEVYWYNARVWRGDGSARDDRRGAILHGIRNTPGGFKAVEEYKPTSI